MILKHHKKSLMLAVILLVMILVLVGCGGQESMPAPEPEAPATVEESPAEPEESAEADLRVFTLEELAEFDGKDGRPAYVAVDGLVYDFTELGRWSGGTHNGFEAGQDLTEALYSVSPHGDRVLSRAPVIGTLE